jgi:hypothetical protein
MASATVNQQPFRFLDLPAEIRCWVYENIEFPTTWHVLDRTQALINKRDWPVPPKAQVYDSRVTLIRPHTPLEILMTCHLVNEEARPILKRKMEHCRFQPVRYLIDYSAAWALVGASSTLRSCLGVADGGISRCGNRVVRNFLQICALYLSQTRRTQSGLRGVRAIEMTITHQSEIVYGREVLETMLWLGQLKYYGPTRLVVIYKSPLPRTQMLGSTEIRDSRDIEELLLQDIPREPGIGDQASSERGVFVRPLEEEAFEKHVEGLESY